jgi:diguanylate cyclase (GGDEF)-like protein
MDIDEVDSRRADERKRNGAGMIDRVELYEATIDSLPEGLALLHEEPGAPHQVVFWNQAAVAITGTTAFEILGHTLPDTLKALLGTGSVDEGLGGEAATHPAGGFRGCVDHKLGHQVSVMVRHLILRDGLGHRFGFAILFHPTDHFDALPRGESGDDESLEASQTDLEDRLQELIEELASGGPPFGVMWISVDQARDLRKTHGAGACETMLQKIEKALLQGLRPGEHLGRWGEDEFLVISHERTPAILADHAQKLAGLARTADFRWWGDRISVTVSIGAAQADTKTTLPDLLGKAQSAMTSSFVAGGNRITSALRGATCLPS